MKCIICHRKEGSKFLGKDHTMISIQSTSHGLVCNKCIDQLVGDVMRMRKPWTKKDLKAWGYRTAWALYGDEEE